MAEQSAVDRISFDILRQLANDARLSNKQLAGAVHLAPSTAHERLKHLSASGAYRGTYADVDLKKLGFGVDALMHIGLAKQEPKDLASFFSMLRSLAEVRQFFVVTGRFDLIVHIAIRDVEHLKNLAYDFTTYPTVERIETSVIFETWKQHELPTPVWLDGPRPSQRVGKGRSARVHR